MRVLQIIIFFIISFLALLWALPIMSQSTSATKLSTFYGAFLDECISRCESKGSLRDSKLENMRKEAARHNLKADFLKRHKAQLIEELIAKDIGTKDYKIHYYLNNRFFNEQKLAMKIPHS